MTDASLDPVRLLDDVLSRAIAAALPEATGAEAMISRSRKPELGDFQSNAAMPLAKQHGRNPRDLAAAIVANLAGDPAALDLLEPVAEKDIAGPGFINMRLRTVALAALLARLDTPALGIAPAGSLGTAVIDLVGVNLAKQMHVGHLRSMIVGDAIARALERIGYTVVRQNHVGDWGLPIAMVTHKVAEEAGAGRIDLDALELDALDRLYRDAQRDCAADTRGLEAARRWNMGPKAIAELEEQVAGAEEAMAGAKATLLKLQSQDPAIVAMWRKIADATLDECLAVCARLNVAVTREHSAGESSYADELAPLVEDLRARGVAEDSEGALVVRVEGLGQPCLIRKSDGGFLYATTDIAAIRRRVQTLDASRVIYCVDARQSLHFRQVFGAAARAGYATRPGKPESSMEHAAFGMVLGEDHRPFKTRSGENVKLTGLLDEADQRAEAIVAAKNADLAPDERRTIARAVAIAAIKYADLSNDRLKDYVFSFDRMLAFEGDTGPYLLYALVRLRSIRRKAQDRGIALDAAAPFKPEHAAERTLALALLRYPGVLAQVGEHLEPHRLCGYLYELATAFSGFFDACPVLAAEDEAIRASRLRMCSLTERVLADGLETLGIRTLDRM